MPKNLLNDSEWNSLAPKQSCACMPQHMRMNPLRIRDSRLLRIFLNQVPYLSIRNVEEFVFRSQLILSDVALKVRLETIEKL